MIDLSPNKLLGHALDPVAMLWMGMLLVAWKFWRLKAYKSSIAMYCLWIFLWCLGASPLSGWMLSRLETPYLRTEPLDLQGVDAAICLGGGMYAQPNERLSFTANDACDRYLTAFDLIETGDVQHLVIGGSDYRLRGKEISEGKLLQNWRERWHLTKGQMHLLSASYSTRDEAKRVADLMQEQGWKQVALVTSAWHMKRSLAVFKRYGIDAVPVGCDFQGTTSITKQFRWKLFPQSGRLESVHLYLHEVVGYGYYQLRGWI